jgi:hypothetical protein
MRLLERPRPDVHVAQLGVLAIEREDLRPAPGLHDQVVRLVVLLAQGGRRHAVAEVGVHGGAHREARDEPAAGQAVQHGELLGDARRRVVESDAIAEDDDAAVLRPAGEGGRHQVRRGHQAVGVLVVLVHADAVEAHLGGELQLVQVLVVDLVSLRRVVQVARHVHPDAAVLLAEVLRKEPVGHEVEEMDLHGLPPLVTSTGRGAYYGRFRERLHGLPQKGAVLHLPSIRP